MQIWSPLNKEVTRIRYPGNRLYGDISLGLRSLKPKPQVINPQAQGR